METYGTDMDINNEITDFCQLIDSLDIVNDIQYCGNKTTNSQVVI